jgi:threonine dehydratase
VIAGQGTIAMEILRQLQPGQPALDAVFVPIGGGGLIAGVANYIKAVRPEVVIGVQMNDSDAMMQSVQAGSAWAARCGPVRRRHRREAGGRGNLPHHPGPGGRLVTVDTDAVCAAIKDIFTDTRSIVEPSGALGVAAIKQYVARHKTKGETYAAILSGANMNFDRLRFVAERAEVGEEREALFAVTIPEERGSFKHFARWWASCPAARAA